MKKIFLLVALTSLASLSAQQHFAGISTSSRTSIVNGVLNPAEFANITSKYEISVFAPSVSVSNNKVRISDLISGDDFDQLIFSGNAPANFRVDGEILGPGISYKYDKWAFALTTKAYTRLDMIDIDVNLGDAIANTSTFFGTTTVSSNTNQRVNGTAWGEVGLSVARNLYDDRMNRFNAGLSLKILFPGSYANFGADKFSGTINNTAGSSTLTNAHANLNIAYSGNLGGDFTNVADYSGSLFGKLNGVAADIGVNYQLLDNDGNGQHRINAGLAVCNIGAMTFKSPNNSSTNYTLDISGTEFLDLNQFENSNSLEEVEQILLDSGYLNKTDKKATDFRVSLPTVLNAYADVRIIKNLFVTALAQHRLKQNTDNAQISHENITSLTPRYLLSKVEFMLPLSVNEISGFATGFAFRAYGFYIGSSSLVTAAINDSKHADFYFGYHFGLD
jgi:hypothetical protein